MSPAPDMRAGDLVEVIGDRGVVYGTIEEIRDAMEFPRPKILDPEFTSRALELLAELRCNRIAMISYNYTRQMRLMFAAMECDGEWRDVQGQLLKIRVTRRREEC